MEAQRDAANPHQERRQLSRAAAGLAQGLDIQADLQISTGEGATSVRAVDRDWVIDAPSAAAACALVRAGPWPTPTRRPGRLARWLDDAGQRLEIRIAGSPILELGRDAHSGLLALVGLRHVRLRSFQAVVLWWRLRASRRP